ncbi:cysteine-rich venom protein 6 [Fopius arisanus]|uniref:Cysteine-rich venom protein 6 n=1 Tax=Fopius arisanus TaxID=64838 RepID=A0A9R1T810_9HYME|nr:PREDICTED: cysteine-rich venom protein 6 [Fopius arisanus]
MSRTKLVCVFIIAVVNGIFTAELSRFNPGSNDICGKNQIWTECGAACPDRCIRHPNRICPIENCVRGCDCSPGFVLDENLECVHPSECPGGGIHVAVLENKYSYGMYEII